MSSEGATPSQPRAGLYSFGPDSQFAQRNRRGDPDERVDAHEDDRVFEPPRVDPGRRPTVPVGGERGFEEARHVGVVQDDPDLAVLGRGPERPVHARDEDRAAVDDDALVVESLDSPVGLQ